MEDNNSNQSLEKFVNSIINSFEGKSQEESFGKFAINLLIHSKGYKEGDIEKILDFIKDHIEMNNVVIKVTQKYSVYHKNVAKCRKDEKEVFEKILEFIKINLV